MPVKLKRCNVLEQLLNARILYEDLEGTEKLLICPRSIQTIGSKDVVKEVSTHIQEHLPDALWKEGAPAHLGVSHFSIFIIRLPLLRVHLTVFDARLRIEMERISGDAME